MPQTLHVRLPHDLHEHLRTTAAEQGVSLNALIATLLAGAIGFTLDPARKGARAADTAGPTTTHQEAPDEQHAAA